MDRYTGPPLRRFRAENQSRRPSGLSICISETLDRFGLLGPYDSVLDFQHEFYRDPIRCGGYLLVGPVILYYDFIFMSTENSIGFYNPMEFLFGKV